MGKQIIDIEQPTIFPPSITAGVTLRSMSAFSPHGFSMLKAKILAPDEAQQHRRAFAQQIGVEPGSLQFQNQVHGTIVRVVKRVEQPEESDGLITNTEGIVLCVSAADCAGVLMCDPEHRVVAGLHSGWRGTHGNIAAVGVGKLREQFASQPQSLLAYISPCASGRSYVVRADVADLFPNDVKQRISEEEWTIDIRKQIYNQLVNEGVHPENIEMSKGCTIGDEQYHSYRRDGELSGRMTAFISLRKRAQE